MASKVGLPPKAMPGHRSPGAGFEKPFEMLTACHERVERMLALLTRLREHLFRTGWDDHAANAAHDVMRYFDQAAPLHHQDEERHVFPALLGLADANGMHAAIGQLKQDHLAMEQLWVAARLVLQRIAQGGPAAMPPLSIAETASLTRFTALYSAHIRTEERFVYPAAQKHLTKAKMDVMALDMMQRRGAAAPALGSAMQ